MYTLFPARAITMSMLNNLVYLLFHLIYILSYGYWIKPFNTSLCLNNCNLIQRYNLKLNGNSNMLLYICSWCYNSKQKQLYNMIFGNIVFFYDQN